MPTLVRLCFIFAFAAGHKMFEHAPSYLQHELTSPFYTHIFNNDIYAQRTSAVDFSSCNTVDCFRSRLTVRMLHYFIQENTLNEKESEVANAPLVNVLTMKQVVARYRSNTVIVGRVLMMLGEEMRGNVAAQIAVYEAATQCLDIEGFAPTPNHRLEFLHSSFQTLSDLYNAVEHPRELIYVTSRLLDDKLWLKRTNTTTKYTATRRLATALLHQHHDASVIHLVAAWMAESVVRDKSDIAALLLVQGQAFMHQQQHDLAEDAFRNALQFRASNAAELLLGECLYTQEKWVEAAAVLESALLGTSIDKDSLQSPTAELIKMTMNAFSRVVEGFANEGNHDLEHVSRQRLEHIRNTYSSLLTIPESESPPAPQMHGTTPVFFPVSVFTLLFSIAAGGIVLVYILYVSRPVKNSLNVSDEVRDKKIVTPPSE